MDFQIPVPGGYNHNEDEEVVPLTPRDVSAASSQESTSDSSVSSAVPYRNMGYLAFFKSHAVPTSNESSSAVTEEKRKESNGSSLSSPSTVHTKVSNQGVECEIQYTDDNEDDDEEMGLSSYMPHRYNTPAPQQETPNQYHRDSVESSSSSVSSYRKDDLSMISSASHLYGEFLVNDNSNLDDDRSTRPPHLAISHSSSRVTVASYSDNPWVNVWRDLLDDVVQLKNQIFNNRNNNNNTLPLSPRSRNLQDLQYLTQQHKSKVQQLTGAPDQQHPLEIGTDYDRHYDFCLVLQPQEVYAFWASLLDFRAELLTPDVYAAMEANWASLYDTAGGHETSSPTLSQASSHSTATEEEEAMDVVMENMSTPGMRRRLTHTNGPVKHHTTFTPLRVAPSPFGTASVRTRLSVFDRAIHDGSTTASSLSESNHQHSPSNMATTQSIEVEPRRRWGNYAANHSTPNAISPPIRSLTRGSSTIRRPVRFLKPTNTTENSPSSVENNKENNPNVLRMEDIPHQVIPRGIAARTNGMLPFLSALKRGIVVRRHRPGHEATFCRIYSTDGGDTIHYQIVWEPEEAMRALKEQRVKYSSAKYSTKSEPAPWSVSAEVAAAEAGTDGHNFTTVPDYVAAKQYREHWSRQHGVKKKLQDITTQWARTGKIHAQDIVAVHPARNQDPRAASNALGTASLRQSKSPHDSAFSFSVVLRRQRVPSIVELEDRWYKGEGRENQFWTLNFEAATEGEYWLICRGLLLLHRDAAAGRFAEQRAAGIGSHYRRLELEQRGLLLEDDPNQLHADEFNEPVTVGCLEKLIVKWRKLDNMYMIGSHDEGAEPPPSDYFLGFKAPGTAIWSRLRQAGLETQRVYSLDPRRVMIKVRCPSDRLMDVAEVLRLKLRTREGAFAPFREDMIDLYQHLNDPLEETPLSGFQFRSSLRQTIIDFIIGSRIRDSGAELGQTTDLGKMIQSRVPLHTHAKLEAIYRSWFFFWRKENWDVGSGHSMTHPMKECDDDDDDSSKSNHFPRLWKRFLKGCFRQPLDSIEQYFGEKVAFYFAWLQHTATHLVFLSIAGLVLFVCQLSSGNWDHPLRPYFSILVMMWTIVVLINWRKRANFLAYRWGTMDYKEQETTRPQFRGDYAQDEITKEWIVTYPKWKRWLKYTISFPLTLLFTGGTLTVILWVHANRDIQLSNYYSTGGSDFQFNFGFEAIGKRGPIVDTELSADHFKDPAFWFIAVGMPSMLGLFLPLLNFILMRLSVALNDFENYRTESEYRSFLIIKVFSFRFVCYFATLYYYSFVSVGDKQAIDNGILRVGTGVLVYTTVAQWWQNILHVCFPMVIRSFRMRHRKKRLTEELRCIEIEEEEISRRCMTNPSDDLKKRQVQLINKRLLLEQAQDETWLELMKPQHDSFPEYIQAVVQFTFVSCFSVVLPITPLICLVNYLMSMRLDAYKLCKGRRRPLPEKTGGIGVWEHLLHIVSVISILTNCWLMGFTSSQLTWIGEDLGYIALFSVVVAWEHIMLLVKYIMQSTISPLPKSVRDVVKREQYEMDQQRNATMMERRVQHQREEESKQEREEADKDK